MFKPLLAGIIVLIIIIGGIVYGTSHKKASQTNIDVSSSKVYCSADGAVSATQTIQSHRSYCILPGPTGEVYASNTPKDFTFSIIDDQGNILKHFQITHTKQLHLIVVRKDLAYFQHIHPEINHTTGLISMSGLMFPADGPYRIFADFAPAGAQMDSMGMPVTATPYEDVVVGSGQFTPAPLGAEVKTKTFTGYQFALATHGTPASGSESMLMFNITQNGKPVTDLEPYLGALGHSVILREGSLDFIHAHPVEEVTAKQNGTVSFMVDFPEAGKYKVFTQFQRGGKVITTDFVLTVAAGSSTPSSMESMPGMNMPGM